MKPTIQISATTMPPLVLRPYKSILQSITESNLANQSVKNLRKLRIEVNLLGRVFRQERRIPFPIHQSST
jgi:hypothetical protein